MDVDIFPLIYGSLHGALQHLQKLTAIHPIVVEIHCFSLLDAHRCSQSDATDSLCTLGHQYCSHMCKTKTKTFYDKDNTCMIYLCNSNTNVKFILFLKDTFAKHCMCAPTCLTGTDVDGGPV